MECGRYLVMACNPKDSQRAVPGGRIGKKYICNACIEHGPDPLGAIGGGHDPSWQNNSNPWQENAIRHLEDTMSD